MLPDLTYWAFLYDAANPADSTSIAYGMLTKIIEPRGSSISYGYTPQPGCKWGQEFLLIGSTPNWTTMPITQRTETDGLGHTYPWKYGPGPANTLSSPQTLVTDPGGNDTLYAYQTAPRTTTRLFRHRCRGAANDLPGIPGIRAASQVCILGIHIFRSTIYSDTVPSRRPFRQLFHVDDDRLKWTATVTSNDHV